MVRERGGGWLERGEGGVVRERWGLEEGEEEREGHRTDQSHECCALWLSEALSFQQCQLSIHRLWSTHGLTERAHTHNALQYTR